VDQGQRKYKDDYGTPKSLTKLLIETGELSGSKMILEPSAGAGHMADVLYRETGITVIANDLLHPIHDYNMSFLDWDENDKYDTIVTNPPYHFFMEFILKAKKVATHKIAMLLPLSYLQGKNRFDAVWQEEEFPLTNIYVFTRFPMFGDPIREDGKFRTGMMACGWYIWDKCAHTKPIIHWLDCDQYVLHGKELKDFEQQYGLKEEKNG
jgi:hypothetical protein